jgi:hypothetical protein
MEAVRTLEALVYFNEATWNNIPGGANHLTCCCENLKSHEVVQACSRQPDSAKHTKEWKQQIILRSWRKRDEIMQQCFLLFSSKVVCKFAHLFCISFSPHVPSSCPSSPLFPLFVHSIHLSPQSVFLILFSLSMYNSFSVFSLFLSLIQTGRHTRLYVTTG